MSGSRDSRAKSSGSWRTLVGGGELGPTKAKRSSTRTSKKSSEYRLGAYIRLSPSDEVRAEGSLVSHPQRIADFVKFKNAQEPGWGEIVEWYTDKDLSGKDLNRPAFKQMCKDIKDDRINAVIVTELSRLSRNVRDFCQFRDFLGIYKAKFFSLKENFDTSTPMGELMVVQAISFSQFERNTIVTRIRDGARARAERGLANGGQRTLGYDPDPHRRCHIVVNESEKPYAEMIFKKFLELGTIAKVQAYLNENGFRTKEFINKNGKKCGGTRWTLNAIHNLLTNLMYVGKREINKKNRSVDPEDLSEGELYRVVDAQWPPIISAELFQDVQSLLESNKKRTRPYVHHYRLAGLVWCGICGNRLVGKSGTGRSGKYFYYGHMRKLTVVDDRHLKKCPMETVPAIHLEEAVISRLDTLAGDQTLLGDLLKESQDNAANQLSSMDAMISAKEQEQRQIQQTVDNLVQTLGQAPGESSRKVLLQKIEELSGQVEAVQNQVRQFKEERRNVSERVVKWDDAYRLMQTIKRAFPKQSPHEQHEILKDIIQRIVVKEDGIVAEYYASPREVILPGGSNPIFDDCSENSEKNVAYQPGPDRFRTPVRTLSALVETVGVEPTSESHLSLESTCVAGVLD